MNHDISHSRFNFTSAQIATVDTAIQSNQFNSTRFEIALTTYFEYAQVYEKYIEVVADAVPHEALYEFTFKKRTFLETPQII